MKHDGKIPDVSCCVIFRCEIDRYCSDQVRRLLLCSVQAHVLTVVDLSGVSLIDSSGIASLLYSQKAGKRYGHGFELAKPSAQVRRVLELAQLSRFFIIRDQ